MSDILMQRAGTAMAAPCHTLCRRALVEGVANLGRAMEALSTTAHHVLLSISVCTRENYSKNKQCGPEMSQCGARHHCVIAIGNGGRHLMLANSMPTNRRPTSSFQWRQPPSATGTWSPSVDTGHGSAHIPTRSCRPMDQRLRGISSVPISTCRTGAAVR